MANANASLGRVGQFLRPGRAAAAAPESNLDTDMEERELLPLPEILIKGVAVEVHGPDATAYATVHVSRVHAGNPLFLTWVKSNEDRGLVVKVRHVGVDEITELRARHATVTQEDADNDLNNRALAMGLLKKAAEYRASDMHIHINGDHGVVQIVVKGELRVLERLDHKTGETLIRAVYQGVAKTKSDSLKPFEYQNAQIPGHLFGSEAGITSIRVVRGPCYPQAEGGQFMTLRLQYQTRPASMHGGSERMSLPSLPFPKAPAGEFHLHEMGYTRAQVEKLTMLLSAPSGLVLFTGPTGSGKTTTLFECMAEMARRRPWDRQVTAEDPVEYPMDWAVQLGSTDSRSDSEAGAAYLEAVRNMLRMAPNVMLIGEIRGGKVAGAALNAAITGHLALSTLHVDDPYLFVDRLEFMDRGQLHRDVFCDPKIIRGVIAQRLLPQLCPHCRIPLKKAQGVLPARILEGLGTRGAIDGVALRGEGCSHCAGDGALGRRAIAEVVVMDDALAADFIKHGTAIARSNYRKRKDADPSMLESAIAQALAGNIDPRAIEKNIDLIVPR